MFAIKYIVGLPPVPVGTYLKKNCSSNDGGETHLKINP